MKQFNPTKRVDDFRCHDPGLVRIDRERIAEAVDCANCLYEQGAIRGVLIADNNIKDWGFLKELSNLGEFIFNGVDTKSLRKTGLGALKNAKSLCLDMKNFDFELSCFENLEFLSCCWFENAKFEDLLSLRELRIFHVSRKRDVLNLALPPSLEKLHICLGSFSSLAISPVALKLKALKLFYIKNLAGIDDATSSLPSLQNIEFENLSAPFDYNCISNLNSLREVIVVKCAEINTWKFVSGKALNRLVVLKTKFPDPSAYLGELEQIPFIDVPKVKINA